MNNTIKVCIITTSMQRYTNDNRSPFIFDLASAIQKRKIDVSIIAMHVQDTQKKEEMENIPVRRLKYFFEKYEVLQETRAGIPAAWEKNKMSIILIILFFMRLTIFLAIHGHEFDLLHANWTLSALSAVLTKPFHRRPVVTTLHGSDIFSATKYRLFKIFTKIAIGASDTVICVSTILKDAITDMGFNRKKIFVIPNGIFVENFTPKIKNNRKNEILFIGSLTRKKGAHLLIEAFSQIMNSFPNFSIRIVGDGPEEEKLKQVSKKLGVEENVIIQKSIPHDKIGKMMQEAFMFVLPSINEGFGIVLLEALASGLPCIAFDSGGVKDVLGDGRGILVEPENVNALSSAITNLINDREMYCKLSENGIVFSQNFHWEIIAKQVVEIYKNVLQNNTD